MIDDIISMAADDKELALELTKIVNNDDIYFLTRLMAALSYVKAPTDINIINNLENNIHDEVFNKQFNEIIEEYGKGLK